MQLYLVSADLSAWRTRLPTGLFPTGLFHGATTSPSILKQSGVPCRVDEVDLLGREQQRATTPSGRA